MHTQRTTTRPNAATPVETIDPFDDYEEDADAAVRRHLGLRPIVYREDDATADPRPCPSWCWVHKEDRYEHEVDPAKPMTATHSTDYRPSCVASLFAGSHHSPAGSLPAHVIPATWEFQLLQNGQGVPMIEVYLRQVKRDGTHAYDKQMKLLLTDAREVVAILSHLIGVADAG